MSKRILLVDGNNLFNRGYHIAKSNKVDSFEFCLKMIFNLKSNFLDAKLLFFFDTCKSKFRTELYPEYKTNRKTKMDEKEYEIFRTKLHDLIEILRVSNVSVFEGEGYEADDYIACISRMLKLQYKITIVSSDRDMCLLINENVRVYDPIKAITITENNFQEIIGIPLKHFLTYKCMIGDTSDNIAGIEGVGEVTAKKMIEEYGRFQNIIEGLKKKDKLFVKEQKILDSIDVFERNKKLIAFDRLYDDAELRQHIKNKVKLLKIDKEKICGLLMRNNCSDLLKKVCEICLEKS